jgi:hypothetical protein
MSWLDDVAQARADEMKLSDKRRAEQERERQVS